MRKEILEKKQRLLQKISKKRYTELIRFVEKVYLADYDLKLLMARKFSNLYFALLPLAQEEYGGRIQQLYLSKFAGKREPIVVSNRALDALKDKIQSGRYKKILLADDIIIHGRTLEGIYQLIKSWYMEAGISDYTIKVYAYAESSAGILNDMESMQGREVNISCNTAQWRAVSNDIVHVFYALGTPYTSYVPNGYMNADAMSYQCLQNMLGKEENGFYCQTSVDMQINSAESYVYVEKDSLSIGLNCSMRIYKYEEPCGFVCVPMVMMKPIEQEVLWECLNTLKDMIEKDFWDILNKNPDSDLVYRTFVYLVSALWGWKFVSEVLKQPASDLQYKKEEELINFHSVIINRSGLKLEDPQWVSNKLQKVCDNYKEAADIDAVIQSETDYAELDSELKKVLEMVKENHSFRMREILGKYLNFNGLLDEKRCRRTDAGNKERRRLMGYPLVKLESELKKYGDEWIRAVLYAIDYGKGSIISKKIRKDKKEYFLSVIHAGEQNYKYFEETYFPFLYGLFEIECHFHDSYEKQLKMKQEFLDKYGKYWIEQKRFILDDDIEQMLNMNVSDDFREVIINTAWDYFEQPDFDKAIKVAQEILKPEGAHGSN